MSPHRYDKRYEFNDHEDHQIRRTPTAWISALPSAGRVEVLGLAGQKTLDSPINFLQ